MRNLKFIFSRKLVCTVKLPPSCHRAKWGKTVAVTSHYLSNESPPLIERREKHAFALGASTEERDDVARYATLSTLPIESALKFRHSLSVRECRNFKLTRSSMFFSPFPASRRHRYKIMVHPDRTSGTNVPIATFRKRVVARKCNGKRISGLVVIQHPVYDSRQRKEESCCPPSPLRKGKSKSSRP